MIADKDTYVNDLISQNEELKKIRDELQSSRDRYAELYDFAPAGHLTLDRAGLIEEVNLSACRMLGTERDLLLKQEFSHFTVISRDFLDCRCKALEKQEEQTCEIEMTTRNGTSFWAWLKVVPLKFDYLRMAMLDITERVRIQKELERYREHLEELISKRNNELKDLAQRLVNAQEKERAAIGNELHDEIGQLLTCSLLLIDRAIRTPDRQILEEAKSTLQDTVSKIRDLSSMLSPRLLRSAGLTRALTSMCKEYERRTNIRVEFQRPDKPNMIEEISGDVALAVYRIIQEALTNVARHAKADEVKVLLSPRQDKLYFEVADNGSGFDIGRMPHSTGLAGMRERALASGGKLTIESIPGKGTRVFAEIPF